MGKVAKVVKVGKVGNVGILGKKTRPRQSVPNSWSKNLRINWKKRENGKKLDVTGRNKKKQRNRKKNHGKQEET